MQQTPSEVFHYTDSRGHSDAILLSKSCTILHAAKRDLLGIIQLRVRRRRRRARSSSRPEDSSAVHLMPASLSCCVQPPVLCVCVLLQDPGLLEGRVTLHHVKAGSVVARQGDQVIRQARAMRRVMSFSGVHSHGCLDL